MAISTGPIEAPIDFDSRGYEECRHVGLDAYRDFREGLTWPENADPAETGPKDYNRYDERIESERRRALASLPSPSLDLPLRSLARLGGHATWGDLEIFFHVPKVPYGDLAASLPLREWYAQYIRDFDAYFPEHRLPDLFGGQDLVRLMSREFPEALEAAAKIFIAASDRRSLRSAMFGVLLRDYATRLRPIVHHFDLSMNDLVRRSLAGLEGVRDPTKDAAAEYLQLLLEEDLPPGPEVMFAALVIPGISEIDLHLPQADVLNAVRALAEDLKSPQEPLIHGHANSDLPTDRDELGVEPLVEGLRALLEDERTGPSLSIGITAPWGGGKSSVMSQLARALEDSSGSRNWLPIRFDAWKYERSERLWAALSKAIYEQSLDSMEGDWERVRFKFGLERARRGWLRVWGWPVLLGGALLAFGVILLIFGSQAAGLLTFGLSALGFSAFAAGAWGVLSDPFKRALDGYVANPSYAEQLGFSSDAERDVRLLTERLKAVEGRSLVVFVDDLDRCSPRNVVDAVEAINQIFNASEQSGCVFVLGMDRDMVAASIEVAYAEAVEQLPEDRQAHFGLHFLAKVVQLSVAVPPPGPAELERLLLSIGSNDPPGRGRAVARPAAEGSAASDGEVSRSLRGEEVAEARPVVAPQAAPDPEGAAQGLDEASPEFQRAELEAIRFLKPNPREVKRFDNAFRLQVHVARRTPGCELDFGPDDLIAIGRWIAMRLRWPALARELDADPALLEKLEQAANRDGSGPGEWGSNAELMALLQEPKPSRRIARLQERTFLRIS